MQKIYLEKAIDLQHQLKELIALSVDESINYKIENEGIRAVGNLIIKGEYRNVNRETFEETLELDILATFDKILDQRDFSIRVEDFDYAIRDGNIHVTIEAGVHGVVSGEDRYINDNPIEEIENLIREDDMLQPDPLSAIPNLAAVTPAQTRAEEAIAQTRVEEPQREPENSVEDTQPVAQEVNSQPVAQEVYSEPAVQEVKREPVVQKEIKVEKVVQEKVEVEEKVENESTVDKKPTRPVDNVQEVEEVKRDDDKQIESVAKDIDEQLQETVYESKSRPIFQDTTDSVGTYYLYIVQEDDTYQSIAERYAGDEVAIKEYNQNRELEVGSVLIIPYAP